MHITFNLFFILIIILLIQLTIFLILFFFSYIHYKKNKIELNKNNIYIFNIISYLNYYLSSNEGIFVRKVLNMLFNLILFILLFILFIFFQKFKLAYSINNTSISNIDIIYLNIIVVFIIQINYNKLREYDNLLTIKNRNLQFNNLIFSLLNYFLLFLILIIIVIIIVFMIILYYSNFEFCNILINDLHLNLFILKEYTAIELLNYLDELDIDNILTEIQKNEILNNCKTKQQILNNYKLFILNNF